MCVASLYVCVCVLIMCLTLSPSLYAAQYFQENKNMLTPTLKVVFQLRFYRAISGVCGRWSPSIWFNRTKGWNVEPVANRSKSMDVYAFL